MERIWLKSYPPGVAADIAFRHDSLSDLLDETAAAHGPRIAYVSMRHALSFAQTDELARQFAAALQQLGLQPGERIALMMPNVLQYPISLFAAIRAGLVVVNCNPLYTARELAYQLNDAGATTLIVLENFAATVEKALPAMPTVQRVIVTSLGDMLPNPKRALVNFVVKRVKKMVPPWRIKGALRFSELLHNARSADFRPAPQHRSDLLFLQYTGGTTGVAKAAMLSHDNLLANIHQACAWLGNTLLPPASTVVTALPFYHIFALTANCLAFYRLGLKNLLIVNARDIAGLVKTLRNEQMVGMTGVNTLFNALLNHPDFARLDFSRLKLSLGGGMAVQQPVAQRWQEVTGCTLLQAYGLTETSPAATINPIDMTYFNGSIGLPLPSTWVSIRNDAGADLPLGVVGEICIKGPQVTAGYWQRERETALAFHADGYFRSGDLGYMNEAGYVFIVDRKKDMILVSGFNVYPNEVEEVAAAHPGVLECAAVGVADARSGEAVKLFVVKKDPQLTAEAVIAHCRENLTAYKAPHIIEFRDELPKTNVGKILRRALKEE